MLTAEKMADVFGYALESLKDSKKKDEAEVIITRLFLLECNHNKKIISMMNWKSISSEKKRFLAFELKTEAARNIFTFVNKSSLGFLFSRILDAESDNEKTTSLISLITKIETIQIISKLDAEGIVRYNKFDLRVKNLEELLNKIIEEIKVDLEKR